MASLPRPGDQPDDARPVPPCNTGGTALGECTAGVDTVALLVGIESADPVGTEASPVNTKSMDTGTPAPEQKFTRIMPSGARLMWGVADVARVESSLPKLAGQWQALAVDQAWHQLLDLWLEAREFIALKPGQVLDNARLSRVDCTRDIAGVLDIGQALDAFAARPLDQRWTKRRYADATANSAQTYRVGPKAWSHVGYDKQAETAGTAPAGTLRLETRASRGLMASETVKRQGLAMHVVADLDADKVDGLSRLACARTGMDQEVAAMDQVARAIMNHPALTQRERNAALAYALQVSLGMPPQVHRNAARKYRRVLGELGVTPEAGCLQQLHGSYSMRLDLDQGKAVYAGA